MASEGVNIREQAPTGHRRRSLRSRLWYGLRRLVFVFAAIVSVAALLVSWVFLYFVYALADPLDLKEATASNVVPEAFFARASAPVDAPPISMTHNPFFVQAGVVVES